MHTQTYSKHLLYLSSQLLHCRNMLLVFIRCLSEWVVLYVDTHIDLYVCVCVINAWQRLLSASPLPEEKSHHAPAEGSRTVSASSFPAANWHQEVVPPHNLNERFPCAVKKQKNRWNFRADSAERRLEWPRGFSAARHQRGRWDWRWEWPPGSSQLGTCVC